MYIEYTSGIINTKVKRSKNGSTNIQPAAPSRLIPLRCRVKFARLFLEVFNIIAFPQCKNFSVKLGAVGVVAPTAP
ncbi:Uncharacterised protein [Chlamydia trachomatis]|nr:Uncharacterised protein [Chlamydia trachomatis]